MFAPEERAHITQDRSQSFSISCESHSQAGSHWRRRLLANYAIDEIYDWSEDHSDFDSQSVFAPRCIFQNQLTSVPGLRTSWALQVYLPLECSPTTPSMKSMIGQTASWLLRRGEWQKEKRKELHQRFLQRFPPPHKITQPSWPVPSNRKSRRRS